MLPSQAERRVTEQLLDSRGGAQEAGGAVGYLNVLTGRLMTLLVMLRATLFTRMTGDSGLHQPIAFVPVGGTGLAELVVAMERAAGVE